MSPPPKPHAVLGIVPDADRATIEAAYRKLIKQHHPDREGGDPEAAKAIIHAYRALTRGGGSARLPVVVSAPPLARRRRRPWRRLMLVSVMAALVSIVPWRVPDLRVQDISSALPGGRSTLAEAEEPLSLQLQALARPDAIAVESAVEEVERLHRDGATALVAYARSCADDLRRMPGAALMDHCLAFDMAAARTTGRLPPWLTAEAMSRRHAAAAVAILKDEVLASARVREVRLTVERILARRPGYSPPASPPAAATAAAAPPSEDESLPDLLPSGA